MFSSIIAWLSKRFPEKLVVTKQDYKELREEVAELNRYVQALKEVHDRLSVVEKDVKQLNNANGFVQTKQGAIRLER